MDGLLVIDKPVGPTSHDVVARVRRVLGERRIGHTGTLDPLASGVLPLVVGRATRLSRFLSGTNKTYDATLRFGIATDSGDAEGRPIGTPCPVETLDIGALERLLQEFHGTFLQQPPRLSAKKIGGVRSHRLARRDIETAPSPAPAEVTLHAADIVSAAGDTATIRVVCSAGFYVRALAHDLGARLGTGAHLAALRRTHVGGIGLEASVALERLDASDGRDVAVRAMAPLAAMLPWMPAVGLTEAGVRRAVHGQEIGAGDITAGDTGAAGPRRLLDHTGSLLGIGEPARTPGFLHPTVVLM
jgi:tRNA pseudouridine55 synthase